MEFPSRPPTYCGLVLGLFADLRCGAACCYRRCCWGLSDSCPLFTVWEVLAPRYQQTGIARLEWRRGLLAGLLLGQLMVAVLRLFAGDAYGGLLDLSLMLLGNTARCLLLCTRITSFAGLSCVAAVADLAHLAHDCLLKGAELFALPLREHWQEDLLVACVMFAPVIKVLGARVAWTCHLEPALLLPEDTAERSVGSGDGEDEGPCRNADAGYGALGGGRRDSTCQWATIGRSWDVMRMA
uniref:Solute carrier family 40 protein n=1 Tax=Alexandrium monilatum TaxID=311494 RepID=A0A7S4VEW1_9DINO|mmetsp:Transcript_53985/g.167537  ORF Transcript_53985/g.167537 Transcript_53985/m.167537 type:complete len:240 (+) Transcript_53985:66-785(+)